jgi:hypothetical protein
MISTIPIWFFFTERSFLIAVSELNDFYNSGLVSWLGRNLFLIAVPELNDFLQFGFNVFHQLKVVFGLL